MNPANEALVKLAHLKTLDERLDAVEAWIKTFTVTAEASVTLPANMATPKVSEHLARHLRSTLETIALESPAEGIIRTTSQKNALGTAVKYTYSFTFVRENA